MRGVSGVDSHETGRIALMATAKPTAVLPVHDSAARENHDAVLFAKGNREILPADEVTADDVPPAHVSPIDAERIVLIKKVIFTLVINETIGIVHPIPGGSKMKLGAI